MDLNEIENILSSEYANDKPSRDYVSTATASINNLTRKRVRDLLSRYATTGMGRSGIGGAAENEIYSNAGESISEVGARGEQMAQQNRSQILAQLLGLAEYKDSKTGVADVLGYLGGALGGSILGPVGGALGGQLAGLLTGGGKKPGFVNNVSNAGLTMAGY